MTRKHLLIIILCFAFEVATAQDLSIYKSEADVEVTTKGLEDLIKSHHLTYFETVAHESIAKSRGVDISPTKVILFEDPDLTTELISCQQTTALDLPLKILVWEENGDVYIGFFDPKDMEKRYMLNGCSDTIEKMTRLMVRLVNDLLRTQ